MPIERYTIDIITDADGDATAWFPAVQGRVLTLIYKKGDYAAGVTLAITTEKTGEAVWSETTGNFDASEIVSPRQARHGADGVVSTYEGSEPVRDYIFLANDRLKVVISLGGDTKSGKFTAIIG